jgi:hypothetical protein
MGFKLKVADGTKITVPDGEFYFNTKARGRRMMLNSLSSDARRVYACLELATMGFQQELAVVQISKDKQRPLTPADIRQQTGLLKQNVSRSLGELEDAGLAQRTSDDEGPLRNGHIQIYSWAAPRAGHLEGQGNRARLPSSSLPPWFPESWEPIKTYISRNKYSLIEDEGIARDYFEEVAVAARAYQEAENRLARALEPVRAQPKNAAPSLLIKNRKNIEERTPTDRPSLKVSEPSNGKAVGRSVDVFPKEEDEPQTPPEIQPRIREWLVKTYALPTPPSQDVLAELARLCRDDAGFEQFKSACTKTQNADPKSYKYFLPIARKCAEYRPEYEEALRSKEAQPTPRSASDDRILKLMRGEA